jgi:hypothetical protein
VSAALREIVDAESIAQRLIAIVEDERSPQQGGPSYKIRLEAIGMIVDRIEGKAVSRSVIARAEAALPVGFESMSFDTKSRILDEIESRATRGDLLDDGTTDADDGGDQ